MAYNVRGYTSSPNCASCPCAKNGVPVKTAPGFGGTGGLCIIGEGPGKTELQQGYPMVGPSGQVLNSAFRDAKIDRGHVFITNAILCAKPRTEEEFEQALACCQPRLLADLERAQPTAICALGNTALRVLQLPVPSVIQARGTVQNSPLYPAPVVAGVHPTVLLRGGAGEMKAGGSQKMNVDAQAMFLFSDVAKAYRIATGQIPPYWSDDIEVVHEVGKAVDAVNALLDDAYAYGALGLDLEWICPGRKNALYALGANAFMAQITWIGLGCEKRAISLRWSTAVESSALEIVQAAMEDPNLPKIMHNKQADIAIWEAQVGSIFGRRIDTMLLHHAVCPGIDHDLQSVSSQYLCVPPWKVQHRDAIKAHEAQMREQARLEKAKKRQEAHEQRNAARKSEKEAKKAQKKAEHEARNAAKKAEKEARKAAKKSKQKSFPF